MRKQPKGLARIQHFVPQFILRNFQCDKNDQIYVYDKHEGIEFRTNIRNVAAENGFYNVKWKDNLYTLEPRLTELETAAAEIINEKIVKEESLAKLFFEERHLLATFIAVQFARVKHRRVINT